MKEKLDIIKKEIMEPMNKMDIIVDSIDEISGENCAFVIRASIKSS